MKARRFDLQRAVDVASRMARWCDFPSLLSAVSGQGKIRITSPIEACSGCGRLYEVVCAPCQLEAMEQRAAERETAVTPIRRIRAAGGER